MSATRVPSGFSNSSSFASSTSTTHSSRTRDTARFARRCPSARSFSIPNQATRNAGGVRGLSKRMRHQPVDFQFVFSPPGKSREWRIEGGEYRRLASLHSPLSTLHFPSLARRERGAWTARERSIVGVLLWSLLISVAPACTLAAADQPLAA